MNPKKSIEGIRNYATGFFFGAGLIWISDNEKYQVIIISIAAVIMLASTFADAAQKSNTKKSNENNSQTNCE
jgi:hypothetical protein